MAGPLNWLSQVKSVSAYGLLSLPQRLGSAATAVIGTAGVVTVLIALLSMRAGFERAMRVSGSPDGAIVLRSGADTEMVSGLSREQTRLIADAPGVLRDTDGLAASAELFVIINLPMRSTGTDANVPLRGVDAAAFRVRDQVKMVEGRRFEWGKNEIIVGEGAARQFAGLDVGKELQVGRNRWAVVGVFSANGGLAESEIWTDARVLQDAYNRGDSFQSVYTRLNSPADFQHFKDSLTSNPQLNVKVVRQTEYYEEQSTAVRKLINTVGWIVSILMAIGAVFAALNTMYSAVAARTREIATLRALGFGSGAVVLSVIIESLALAALGCAIGAGSAYLLFDGFRTATVNWQSFSQVTFAFAVTPELVLSGVLLALAIGLVGGLLPALRAARLPIATALREL